MKLLLFIFATAVTASILVTALIAVWVDDPRWFMTSVVLMFGAIGSWAAATAPNWDKK